MSSTEAPRSFAVLLHELGDGSLLALLSAELQDVVGKCQDFALDQGSPGLGEVTLKLSFKAERNGTCAVKSAVTSKAPRAKLPPQGLWISKGGNLLTENPRQAKLEFRDVSAPAAARSLPPRHAHAHATTGTDPE